MRKTLSFQEQQLFELFSNFNYKLPKDPELILYDFYFLTAFGEEISGRNMNANYAIEAASNDIVDMLHKHMKDAVFYALCAEIRHLFDYYRISGVQDRISKDDLKFIQEYFKQLREINHLTGKSAVGLGIDIIDEIMSITDRDRTILTAADEGSRLKSYRAVKMTMKKLNYSKSRFAIWAENMFDSDGWSSSYGGKPWASIAEALYKLERAGKKQEKIIWIDHAYDLQHNTDTVFNKLKLYYKDGGYQWIKRALDWKRDVTDLKAFYKKVSTQLRPMVAYISKATTGKSIISAEDEEEGHSVAAAKANLQVSNDDIANFSNSFRRDGVYAFEEDDIVKIVDMSAYIQADNNVMEWGIQNNLNIKQNGLNALDISDDHKVIAIGENDYFPGKVVVVIQPNGTHNHYLFFQEGLKKKPMLKLGTQMHDPNTVGFKFQTSDIVTVVDNGETYITGSVWGDDLNYNITKKAALENESYYVMQRKWSNDEGIYVIQRIGTSDYFIIGENGIELSSPNNNVPDSLVNDLSGSIQDPEDDYTDVSSYSSQWDNVKIRTTDLPFIQTHISEFDWIKEASIKDAHLKLSPDNELIFESGTWEDGWWKDGIFQEGIWQTGHWINGIFDGGVWESGKWDKGWWKSGVWESGEIKDAYGDYLYSHDEPE